MRRITPFKALLLGLSIALSVPASAKDGSLSNKRTGAVLLGFVGLPLAIAGIAGATSGGGGWAGSSDEIRAWSALAGLQGLAMLGTGSYLWVSGGDRRLEAPKVVVGWKF